MSNSGLETVYLKKQGKSSLSQLIHSIYKFKFAYILVLPGLLLLLVFTYFPMYGILLAFKSYNVSKGIFGSPFVGLDHFITIMGNSDFWYAFSNTIIISLGRIIFCFPVPIIFAILFNEMREGIFRKSLQVVYTFPHFLSWVVMSGIVVNMLSTQDGVVNNILAAMGHERVMFLANPHLFKPMIYILSNLKETGWNCIIYMAAIAGINPELYEAAMTDGANRWHRIRHITWPGIQSMVIICLILAMGSMMNAGFDQIFNLQNDVIQHASDIIDTYIYRVTFKLNSDFGFSTAVGLFKAIINIGLMLAANKVAKRVSGTSVI